MISLIAIANVFNTISTNIKLRKRELSMLRSVGMSDKDFQKMMNYECVFYGIRTLVFGLILALIASWFIYKGIVASGMDIGYTLPLQNIITPKETKKRSFVMNYASLFNTSFL